MVVRHGLPSYHRPYLGYLPRHRGIRHLRNARARSDDPHAAFARTTRRQYIHLCAEHYAGDHHHAFVPYSARYPADIRASRPITTFTLFSPLRFNNQ